MAIPTLFDSPTARLGLLRKWTGPMLQIGLDAGCLFDAVLQARNWTDRRETWFGSDIGRHKLEAPYTRDVYLEAADLIVAALSFLTASTMPGKRPSSSTARTSWPLVCMRIVCS